MLAARAAVAKATPANTSSESPGNSQRRHSSRISSSRRELFHGPLPRRCAPRGRRAPRSQAPGGDQASPPIGVSTPTSRGAPASSRYRLPQNSTTPANSSQPATCNSCAAAAGPAASPAPAVPAHERTDSAARSAAPRSDRRSGARMQRVRAERADAASPAPAAAPQADRSAARACGASLSADPAAACARHARGTRGKPVCCVRIGRVRLARTLRPRGLHSGAGGLIGRHQLRRAHCRSDRRAPCAATPRAAAASCSDRDSAGTPCAGGARAAPSESRPPRCRA